MKVSKPFLNIIPPKLFLLRWFVNGCNFCVILYIKIRRIKISTFLNTCSESPENHSSRNCVGGNLCAITRNSMFFSESLWSRLWRKWGWTRGASTRSRRRPWCMTTTWPRRGRSSCALWASRLLIILLIEQQYITLV